MRRRVERRRESIPTIWEPIKIDITDRSYRQRRNHLLGKNVSLCFETYKGMYLIFWHFCNRNKSCNKRKMKGDFFVRKETYKKRNTNASLYSRYKNGIFVDMFIVCSKPPIKSFNHRHLLSSPVSIYDFTWFFTSGTSDK